MKKIWSELVTWVNDLIIKQLLMTLLNAVNENVWRIQESSEAKALCEKLMTHIFTDLMNQNNDDQLLAKTVAEVVNLDMNIEDLLENLSSSTSIVITHSDHHVQKPSNMWDEYWNDKMYAELLRDRSSKQIQSDDSDKLFKNDSDEYQEDDEETVNENSEDERSVYRSDELTEQEDDETVYHLMLMTFKHLKMMLKNKTVTEQEMFNQEELNLQMIIDLDPLKVYTNTDLNDVAILKNVLILLCQARFEAEAAHIQITSHINYDALSHQIASAIKNQMVIDKEEYIKLFSHITQ